MFCRGTGIQLGLALFMFMIYTTTIAYRGCLNAVLTVKYFPKPIDSLRELSDLVRRFKNS